VGLLPALPPLREQRAVDRCRQLDAAPRAEKRPGRLLRLRGAPLEQSRRWWRWTSVASGRCAPQLGGLDPGDRSLRRPHRGATMKFPRFRRGAALMDVAEVEGEDGADEVLVPAIREVVTRFPATRKASEHVDECLGTTAAVARPAPPRPSIAARISESSRGGPTAYHGIARPACEKGYRRHQRS